MPLKEYPMNSRIAARYLNISVGYLYNLTSRGEGPAHVKYGGQLRFRREDLNNWIASRCQHAPPGGE